MTKKYILPVKFSSSEKDIYDLCISKREKLFKNILWIACPIFILLLISVIFLFLCISYNFFGYNYSVVLNSTIVREYGLSKIFVITNLLIIVLGFIAILIIDFVCCLLYPIKINKKTIKCLFNPSNNKIRFIVLQKRKILDSESINLSSFKDNIDVNDNVIMINKEGYIIASNPIDTSNRNIITDVTLLENVIMHQIK